MAQRIPAARAEAPEWAARHDRDECTATTIVLGLGNLLLGDDGAGVHVIRHLHGGLPLPNNVRLLDGGTLNFTLLQLVESASLLVVVDACDFGAEPGAVRILHDAEMDEYLSGAWQRSVHDLNLGDLLRMCALRGGLPDRRALVAIQPESIEWSETPTDTVSTAIDVACDRIRALVSEDAS